MAHATSRLLVPLFGMLLLLPLASGCGGGNEVKVSGKLQKGGARYTPPQGHNLTITFVAIEAKDAEGKKIKNEPFQAMIDPDGESFNVPGREGSGIPPGKYRVAVTQRMNREAFEAAKPQAEPGKPPIDRETDFLDEKFSVDKSPIIRDIPSKSPVVVDLDKPTEG